MVVARWLVTTMLMVGTSVGSFAAHAQKDAQKEDPFDGT